MSTTPDNPTPANRKVIGTMTTALQCALTPHEIEKKNAALLECHRKLAAHESHESNVKAQLKRDRTAIESEMHALVGVLTSKYEMRDVEVEKIADYDAGLIRLIRVDTGAEVDVERMSEAQKQTEFDLREKAAEDAARPTNPDDIGPDVDPWGAPSDGRAPVAELPHDPDVIDAEFVEGDDADDDDGAAESEEPPAAADSEAGLTSDELRIKHLVEWLPSQGAAVAREYLDSAEVDDVRAIYTRVVGEPAGRGQKRTLIPKIIDRLFNAPF